MKGKYEVKVWNNRVKYKLVAAGLLTRNTVSKYKDRIIVADETCECLYLDWFVNAINENQNYFLIVTRNSLASVDYSVREIYELRSKKMVNCM